MSPRRSSKAKPRIEDSPIAMMISSNDEAAELRRLHSTADQPQYPQRCHSSSSTYHGEHYFDCGKVPVRWRLRAERFVTAESPMFDRDSDETIGLLYTHGTWGSPGNCNYRSPRGCVTGSINECVQQTITPCTPTVFSRVSISSFNLCVNSTAVIDGGFALTSYM